MNETDYWKQFEKTGKIQDYLNYREEKAFEGREDTGYAGVRGIDGIGLKGRADRGI